MYKRKKIVYINDINEFNKHLEFVKECRNIIYKDFDIFNDYLGLNAYIDDKMVEINLTYKLGKEAKTYTFKKDGSRSMQKISGMDAWTVISHYYKCPVRKANFSAKPILWKSTKYDGTRNYCYEYDRNSAYANVLRNYRFPDTSVDPESGIVPEDHIGFDCNGNLCFPGQHSPFYFPLMDSPFTKFIDNWSQKKIKAKTPEERQKAKDVMNYVVGYFQHKNPFIRAYVVNICNKEIESLIDNNTIYCNTDAIVSLVPRPEFTLSDKLGEWKLKEGMFAYKGFNYQWDKEVPSYRHIPKSWFSKDFDLLTDEVPSNANTYYFDKVNVILKEIENGKED